jgi:hypothetical protein
VPVADSPAASVKTAVAICAADVTTAAGACTVATAAVVAVAAEVDSAYAAAIQAAVDVGKSPTAAYVCTVVALSCQWAFLLSI